MPNEKTDSAGFATVNTDKERSDAAIGDTTTSVGVPGDKRTAANFVDTATLAAAKSTQKTDGNNVGEKENTNEER